MRSDAPVGTNGTVLRDAASSNASAGFSVVSAGDICVGLSTSTMAPLSGAAAVKASIDKQAKRASNSSDVAACGGIMPMRGGMTKAWNGNGG